MLQLRRIYYHTGSETDLQQKPQRTVSADDNDNYWLKSMVDDNDLTLDDSPAYYNEFFTDNYSKDKLAPADLLAEANTIINYNANDIRKNLTTVATKIPFLNYDALSAASATVATILTDSKKQVWGLHISALANYVVFTYSHSINVAIMTCILGKKLAIPADQLNNLIISAFLHDIGMVVVPHNILTATKPLSDEDQKLIHEHPSIGYHMLLNTTLPREILLAVLQHHERIDGEGYPHGLKAADITYFAKLLRIVDTFDSITSDRPYRCACSVPDAIAKMKAEGAGEFDKNMFNTFIQLFKI